MPKFEYIEWIKVKMDGKHIGDIRPVDRGYAFFPKGSKISGDVFPTISAVERSLEAE